jgi:repressor LexA
LNQVLTRKQRAIYDFIVDCVHREGIPPSLTEIARAFNLAAVSGVADHLIALERKGFIRRRRGISRGIELVDASAGAVTVTTAVRVPVVGTLPSRRHISWQQSARRHLTFDGRVAKPGSVAIRVDSPGLETRGILPGDYLIVVRSAAPKPGELGIIDAERGTALVEVLPERHRVRRVPDDVEVSEDFKWVGRVMAVLRSMDDN